MPADQAWTPRSLRPAATWAPAVLVLAAALLPYVTALEGGFVYDDHLLVEAAPRVREPDAGAWSAVLWGSVPAPGYVRPVVTISLALDHATGGGAPFMFHLTNLILHAVLALVAWRVVRRLCGAGPAALAAGVLFAVHPLHVEPTVWISGRGDLLAALLGFGAWWALLAGGWLPAAPAREGSPPPARAWGLAVAFPLLLAALLAKESAVAFLLLVPWAVWVGPGARRWPPRRHLATLGCAAAGLVVWVAVRWAVLGSLTGPFPVDPLENPAVGLAAADRLATAGRALATALRLLFWPHPLRLDYAVPVLSPVSWSSRAGLASLGLLAGAAALVWLLARTARRRPAGGPLHLLALGGGFLLLAWLPVSSLGPPAGTLLAERFLLLPSWGWALAAAGGLQLLATRLPARAGRPAALGLFGGLSLALGLTGAARTPVWADDASLFAADVRLQPVSYRAAYLHGLRRLMDGDSDEARRWLERCVLLAPGFSRCHAALGHLYLRTGDVAAAVASARRAVAQEPDFDSALRARYRVLLAEALLATGDGDRARALLQAAAALDPVSATPLRLQGDMHFAAGRYDEAAAAYSRALEHDPEDVTAGFNRAMALLRTERQDQARQALAHLSRQPQAPAAVWFHLGLLAEAAGRRDQAAHMYEAFLDAAEEQAAAASPAGRPDASVTGDLMAEARRRRRALTGGTGVGDGAISRRDGQGAPPGPPRQQPP